MDVKTTLKNRAGGRVHYHKRACGHHAYNAPDLKLCATAHVLADVGGMCGDGGVGVHYRGAERSASY